MAVNQKPEQLLLRIFKSDELGKTLFIDSHIGHVICQPGTGLLVANTAFAEMTGYSRNELQKMRYTELVPEESMQWITEVIFAKLENENASDVFEHRIVQKTGGQLWVQSRIYKLEDELLLVKHIDITGVKITEAELMRALNLHKKQLPDTISGTERAIARLVAVGLSSKEIADQINLEPRTIDNHRSNIRRKLFVRHTFALRDTLQSYRFD